MLESSLKKRLQNLAAEYETRDFFAGGRDPSAFMREVFERGGSDANKEATAFVASCLSFGSISQFVPKIRSLVEFARGDMAEWICSGAFARDIPADSKCKFYRFVSYGNLLAFFKTYSRLMRKWGTLGNYVKENCDGTGLCAVKAICAAFADSGSGSLVPVDATSACKRLCMFLRWMTRSNSPVDLGLWSDFIDRRTFSWNDGTKDADYWELLKHHNDWAFYPTSYGFMWDNSDYSTEVTALTNAYETYRATLETGSAGSAGVEATLLRSHPSDGRIFTISGQLTDGTQQLRPGIYIQNGRKFVIK